MIDRSGDTISKPPEFGFGDEEFGFGFTLSEGEENDEEVEDDLHAEAMRLISESMAFLDDGADSDDSEMMGFGGMSTPMVMEALVASPRIHQ